VFVDVKYSGLLAQVRLQMAEQEITAISPRTRLRICGLKARRARGGV